MTKDHCTKQLGGGRLNERLFGVGTIKNGKKLVTLSPDLLSFEEQDCKGEQRIGY